MATLVSLAKVAQRREVAFEYGGEMVVIVFSPRKANSYWLMRVADADNQTVEAAADLLVEVIVEWNLADDDQPLPVSRESLLELPVDLRLAIQHEILEALNPPA